MIRGCPSISTTGIAGDSTVRKYGSRPASRAARSNARVVAANLCEDVDGSWHIGWVG